MILDADQAVYDWKGEEVVENPPAGALAEVLTSMGKLDRFSEMWELLSGESAPPFTKAVTVGRLIAPYVATGTGVDAVNGPQCFTVAAKLYTGGDVELSNSDVEIIKMAVQGSSTPQMWVKGLVTYLLDPEGVPEAERTVFEKYYSKRAAKRPAQN